MKNYIKELIESKKRYKEYKNAKEQLPTDYAKAMDALEKYMFNFAKGDGFMEVIYQVLDLLVENSNDQVPLKQVIGEDPVAFADEIMAQYPDELWIVKMQNQLRKSYRSLN